MMEMIFDISSEYARGNVYAKQPTIPLKEWCRALNWNVNQFKPFKVSVANQRKVYYIPSKEFHKSINRTITISDIEEFNKMEWTTYEDYLKHGFSL